MPEHIGYVGVGLMGGPMARRLAAQGYAVRACDIVAARRAEAVAAGAAEAASPADAARGADLVALNLPTTAAVEAAVFGPEGVAETMRPPAILVDFSTIEVESCRSFAARLHAATGCAWIDAPVSGGPVASGNGTLTVMAGGAASDIARLRPLFAAIAANFTHVGRSGDGLVAKMIGQHIVGCLHTVLAEAARLAELSGIDAASVPAAVAGGHADGVLLRQLYPRMVARDFGLRAYARQLVKDMHMVEALAARVGLSAPMLRQSCAMYEALLERGGAEQDVAAVVTMYEDGVDRKGANMLLADKVAVITGAASVRGIGRATAKRFAAEGARVVIVDLDDAACRAAAAELGPRHRGHGCDVVDAAACDALAAAVLAECGQIDILVNYAGVSHPDRLMEATPERYDLVMNVNVKGTFNMCRAVVPHMRARRSGNIVTIGSVAAQRGGGLFGGPHYSASKGAVQSLAKAMARELGPDGIRVNAIAPGTIDTDIFAGKLSDERKKQIAAEIPLGRLGTPDDVAKACLFLVSDLSSFVTGSVLDVNGGILIHQ